MASASDLEMIAQVLSLMIDKAVANRELAQSAMRDARQGEFSQEKQVMRRKTPPKRRKVSKYAKELGKQWKLVKKKSRKKNGDYRSGWNQTRELLAAHKATKKAMKK